MKTKAIHCPRCQGSGADRHGEPCQACLGGRVKRVGSGKLLSAKGGA